MFENLSKAPFNDIFNFMEYNNFFDKNQLEFRLILSYMNQMISITYSAFCVFDTKSYCTKNEVLHYAFPQ